MVTQNVVSCKNFDFVMNMVWGRKWPVESAQPCMLTSLEAHNMLCILPHTRICVPVVRISERD